MFAKRFFHVCAGLLCLALAYHLGATTAGAKPRQSGIVVDAGDVNGQINVVVGRVLTRRVGALTTSAPFPIPGSSRVVAAGSVSYRGAVAAVLENGDVYEASGGVGDRVDDVGQWILVGSMFGTP